MIRSFILAAAAIACIAPAAPAWACSRVVPRGYSEAAARGDARLFVERANAIIDAEVVRPHGPNGEAALVRAHRVLKGPQQELFEIGERDSCDLFFAAAGERVRLRLTGGPDLYYAQGDDRPELTDALLGSDRRRDWPWRAGGRAAAE